MVSLISFNCYAYEQELGKIWEYEEMRIEAFSGNDARKYFMDIANLRIDTFKDFPYLYEGSLEVEKEYLESYFASKTSVVILVFDGNKIVGFSNSIPLEEEMDEITMPFKEKNIDLRKYLYVGEVIIRKTYRGKGILRKFFEHHEKVASQNGREKLTFMTVERAPNHPERPKNYRTLEPIWQHFGCYKLNNIKVVIPWDRIDTKKEEPNYLEIWEKEVL
jgi:GNAT superfamily N-acetyltransferase